MGMGAIPASAWCIGMAQLTELCPSETTAFMQLCNEFDLGWQTVAELLDDNDPSSTADEEELRLIAAWQALAERFNEVTTVDGAGLELHLGYYDEDIGDRYDELDQPFYFSLEGVQQFTPAAQKFAEKIEHKTWTQYG